MTSISYFGYKRRELARFTDQSLSMMGYLQWGYNEHV